jgi:glutaredoxin 3
MAHNVIIYTTPTCKFCHAAKEFFKEHQVAYTELDVFVDEKARADMVGKSGQLGVPVVDIDGNIVIGFDKPRLKQYLGINE